MSDWRPAGFGQPSSADAALMKPETISEIVERRDRAIAAYAAGYAALQRWAACVSDARAELKNPPTMWSTDHRDDRVNAALNPDLPLEGTYAEVVQRLVDGCVWAEVLGRFDLDRLMDAEAKRELRKSLRDNPIPVTAANVEATVRRVLDSAGEMFLRGLANCFAGLDGSFKSHDAHSFGFNIILPHALESGGWWNSRREYNAVLRDVERVFFVLDGKPVPDVCEVVEAINTALRAGGRHAELRRTKVETTYFIAKTFKNGAVHIRIRHKAHLMRINLALAEYFGAVLPSGDIPVDDGDLFERAPEGLVHAKNLGYFPSPEPVVEAVVGTESLRFLRVLEPSAGDGALAMACARLGAKVTCVELEPSRAAALAAGPYERVIPGDFLALEPGPELVFDWVVMNPPFANGADLHHVVHALRFLRPGGKLVAVMSTTTAHRQGKRWDAFRAYIHELAFREHWATPDLSRTWGRQLDQTDASWTELPARSFASVGTNVNAAVLKLYVPKDFVAK